MYKRNKEDKYYYIAFALILISIFSIIIHLLTSYKLIDFIDMRPLGLSTVLGGDFWLNAHWALFGFYIILVICGYYLPIKGCLASIITAAMSVLALIVTAGIFYNIVCFAKAGSYELPVVLGNQMIVILNYAKITALFIYCILVGCLCKMRAGETT